MQPDTRWRGLYSVAAIAVLITVVAIPVQLAAFAIWPPPYDASARVWFELFDRQPVVALLSMDVIFLLDYALLIPIVLAIYVALRRHAETLMLVGAALFFVSIAAYFASNPAIDLLQLSRRYLAATSDADRLALLGAGSAALASLQGTAFHVSYVLGSVAGVLLMLPPLLRRDTGFSRTVAVLGVAGNVIGLGLYLPKIGVTVSAFSGAILWCWYLALGWQLYRLGHPRAERSRPVSGAQALS